MLILGWVCMVVAICLWTLATIRMTSANQQSRIPWIGRPANQSMATNVAQFVAFLTLCVGLTLVSDRGSVAEEWLAFCIAFATVVVIVTAILMHNHRVKFGE